MICFKRIKIFFCISWKNWPFLDLEMPKFGIYASKLASEPLMKENWPKMFFCRILIHPTWCSSCPGLGHNSIRIFVENKYLAIIVKFVIFQSPFLLSSSWPTSGKTSKRLPMVQYLKLHPFILIMLSFQRCTIIIIEVSQILHCIANRFLPP